MSGNSGPGETAPLPGLRPENKGVEALISELHAHPEGVTVEEAFRKLFKMPGALPPNGREILARVLGPDRRVALDGTRVFAKPRRDMQELYLDTRMVMVDVETTGLSAESCALTEIAAVLVDFPGPAETFAAPGFRIVSEFVSLVNPGVPIPAEVTAKTGITNELVANAPPLRDVMPRFLAALGDRVIVAHNSPFDLSFLNAAARNLYGCVLANESICSLKIARRLFPQLPSRSLGAVAAHLRVRFDPAGCHRALADTRLLAHVMAGMRPLYMELIEKKRVADAARSSGSPAVTGGA